LPTAKTVSVLVNPNPDISVLHVCVTLNHTVLCYTTINTSLLRKRRVFVQLPNSVKKKTVVDKQEWTCTLSQYNLLNVLY